jgi:hypothetical protein
MGIDSWLADDAATLDELLATGHDELISDDFRRLTGCPAADAGRVRAGFRGRLPNLTPWRSPDRRAAECDERNVAKAAYRR